MSRATAEHRVFAHGTLAGSQGRRRACALDGLWHYVSVLLDVVGWGRRESNDHERTVRCTNPGMLRSHLGSCASCPPQCTCLRPCDRAVPTAFGPRALPHMRLAWPQAPMSYICWGGRGCASGVRGGLLFRIPFGVAVHVARGHICTCDVVCRECTCPICCSGLGCAARVCVCVRRHLTPFGVQDIMRMVS